MSRRTRLLVVLSLNLVLVVGLVVVGATAGSVGVLAAGADYLADGGAIAVALLAIWLRARPATARRPGGYPMAPAYAALVNAGLLFLVVTTVAVEAVRRLVAGTETVRGVPVLVASGTAAAVMVAGALILRADESDDDDTDADRANMRAVLLDTVADAAAAAGVAAAGAVIAVTGAWYWLDPAVALVISAVIGYHVVALLRDVAATMAQAPHR